MEDGLRFHGGHHAGWLRVQQMLAEASDGSEESTAVGETETGSRMASFLPDEQDAF